MQAVAQNLGRLPERVSADAGYFSSAAVTDESVATVDIYVPPNTRQPKSQTTLPEHASVPQRMWHKLQSKAGAAVYNQRKVIVEPVFAYLKHVRGFRQFLLRSLACVQAEWLLMCLTHNVLKMFRAKRLQNA